MKDSIVFYRSFFETIMQIENEGDQLALFKAICEYGFNETEASLSGINKLLFGLIKPQIDANNYKSKVGKANGIKGKSYGSLGGRPSKKTDSQEVEGNPQGVISETPRGFSENPHPVITETPRGLLKNPHPVSKKPPNVNVNVNENENVNGNANENENEKKRDKSPKKASASSSANASSSPEAVREISVLIHSSEQSAKKPKPGTADGRRPAKSFKQWNEQDLIDQVEPFIESYGSELCDQFISYWSEPTASGRIRVNSQDAFEVKRRLDTFLRNSKTTRPGPAPEFKTKAAAEKYIIDTYFRGKEHLSPKLNYGVEIADENGNPRKIEDINREVDAKIRGDYA